MENVEAIKSVLSLKNIYFESISFRSTGEKTDKGEAEIGFGVPPVVSDGACFTVKIQSRISIPACAKIDLTIVGDFEAASDRDINKLIPNAIAIIFPYLRSEISLITSQPNMAPLVVPAVNINALLNKVRSE